MADVDIAPNFGLELKDGFKPVNAWVSNGITWLDDIQQFYRERSAIEKEYSAKLNTLAKKYYEKKAKKSSSLSVGDTPALTPGSLESASLTTWTTQLTTLESRAAEHDRYGGELISQLADPLKHIATRFEELRKRHADFAAKLEAERDGTYADLRKTKGKYDATCQEVENKRKKAESAFDYSKSKAQNAYQQQILEMHNVKNTYLIAINVTNKQKERYYHEYVPDLLDSLQDLSESRTAKLNGIWALAAQLELGMLKRSTDFVNHLAQEIPRNQPVLDSMMFVRHNAAGWQEPPNKQFEPSPVWHDDGAMMVDDTAKVFLRNVLSKSKGQLGELRREVDKKRREVEGAKRVKQQIREGKDKRDEVEVVKAIFALQENLHEVDHKRLTAEVETITITEAVGDVTLGAKSHNFKSQTFKIPTNCDLCGERIWGLSAKGFDCRDCGYTCHSKCEMKVPAECPGEQTKEERKKLKAERQEAANSLKSPTHQPGDSVAELPTMSRTNTMNSLSSGYAASAHRSVSGSGPRSPADETPPERPTSAKPSISGPTTLRKNRVVAPPPSTYVSELPGSAPNGSGAASSDPKGKMLYAYDANGDGEVTVAEGKEVTILEPDDGGWTKVKVGYKEGLVPTAYIEILPMATLAPRPSSIYSNSGSSMSSSIQGKKQGPVVAPRRGAKKLKYVEALYEYSAQSDAEHSMTEGERFVLIKEDPGDGWAEVERNGVTKSVPANYVQAV
ncbi:Cysteine-rich [Glarea lozoyensis ATCC 20868]|uniref:Protein BZZ1 n=1 Tax=Glarea lozoyensis (strain ATCC 20868 / MF5171) TaxID=1116229 RepID=S3DL65_GLAL2|nr:Cysteine-rich [Glarea lozoyensis ATCC 20868]EPE27273.1 Cysteine-rich [Glarea lozoyensis ATCC 20868]